MPDYQPIDAHIGSRLREAREGVGLTQVQLANAVRVSFQQIQKYERGVNRVAASRLFVISKTVKKPLSYFFEELPADVAY